jgi:hypothetical protein
MIVVVPEYDDGVVVVPCEVLSTSVSAYVYVNESPTANGKTTVPSGNAAAAGNAHAKETSPLNAVIRRTLLSLIVDLQENACFAPSRCVHHIRRRRGCIWGETLLPCPRAKIR